jgi:signal transduction histidine kinase
MPVAAIAHRYAELLQRAVFADDPLTIEAALCEAADLGRELVVLEMPLEEVGEMHHEALIQLGNTHPDLMLTQVAGRITVPLMEAYMAYSLAFRVQLEQRTEMIVNARLEQSRRLEAIGTLAAGIAHDFNNILGVIVGFSELLSDELPANSSAQNHLGFIQQASFRARDLIARMLTFARTMADTPVPVEVVTLIQDTMTLLRASLPIAIRLDFTPAVPAAWVLAEPSQIQQIVMNLCINAADAINNRQGVIAVGLSLVPSTAPARAMLRLTVQDDGEGMPPEICQRVFDPFFTTKAPGKGTGLGLSVIHGLVGKLGGMIAISSSPGAGSRFIIDLPQLVERPPNCGILGK